MQRISIQHIQSFEQFYRIPKVFFTAEKYKNMKLESKTAYAILRDRFELSLKNGWIDNDDKVFFIYSVQKLGEILGCGKSKVIAIKQDLAKHGLLEEERQGLNQPNRLYIGLVDKIDLENMANPLVEPDVLNSDHRKSEKQTTGSLKIRRPVVSKSDPNDTENSDTDLNHTENKSFENNDDELNIFNKQNKPSSIDQKTKSDVDLLAEQYCDNTNGKITPIKKRKLAELVNRFGGLLVSEAITKAALNDSKSLIYIERVCESMSQEEHNRLFNF
ncbi:hypothetical protein R55210_AODCCCNP_01310 [Fructobacillus fructosus]|uniref:replication initiator protein A n=1 Tax=Fructobacillus fructosus TaxID=1631 RepID=UPI002DA04C42|nr:hypothetical protein R55210_AODCCCNP_01310 [Fructobacillus fructosus]